jgi:hypothetical protein
MLWNLAAANGHRDAVAQRSALARSMTEEQIAEAQRMSRDWRRGTSLPARSHPVTH